jgi:hypothetical protein
MRKTVWITCPDSGDEGATEFEADTRELDALPTDELFLTCPLCGKAHRLDAMEPRAGQPAPAATVH